MSPSRIRRLLNIPEDKSLPVLEKVITQEGIDSYASASGDRNPLHLDPEFAAGTQFGGIIAHGMLTLAFVWEMLTQAFEQTWLERGNLKVRFEAPAYPGDRVHTWGEIVKEQQTAQGRYLECAVALRKDDDKTLIRGTATVTLPNP